MSLNDPFESLPVPDSLEESHRVGLVAADLAHLDSGALLDVLLERVQHILAVDTVAVLLVDTAATQLVAHAARGLEEELRQGTRVPIGRGFAGRIASDPGGVRSAAATVSTYQRWKRSGDQPRWRTSQS